MCATPEAKQSEPYAHSMKNYHEYSSQTDVFGDGFHRTQKAVVGMTLYRYTTTLLHYYRYYVVRWLLCTRYVTHKNAQIFMRTHLKGQPS